MKKLNNVILNNIVEKFVKRRKYKERKTLSWLKFIPLTTCCIPIIEAYVLLKNKSMKNNIVNYMIYAFLATPIMYILFFILSLFATLGTGILLNVIYKWDIKGSQFFDTNGILLLIFALIFDLIFCNFMIKEDKLYTINMDKELHKKNVFSEMLTKEDFELIMKSIDNRIIKKAINDSGKDGLSYDDLSHLDELLNNKKETLDEINKREFKEIFKNINENEIAKKLKGKNKIEMIQYFENLGIEIKNKNKIIEEDDNNLYSKIISDKEDHKEKILKERSLKTKKEELPIT